MGLLVKKKKKKNQKMLFIDLRGGSAWRVSYQAVGRPGLPGSSLEPHLEASQHLPVPKHLPSSGGADEPSDLEELEKFAKTFKQRRIKLGFTQVWF